MPNQTEEIKPRSGISENLILLIGVGTILLIMGGVAAGVMWWRSLPRESENMLEIAAPAPPPKPKPVHVPEQGLTAEATLNFKANPEKYKGKVVVMYMRYLGPEVNVRLPDAAARKPIEPIKFLGGVVGKPGSDFMVHVVPDRDYVHARWKKTAELPYVRHLDEVKIAFHCTEGDMHSGNFLINAWEPDGFSEDGGFPQPNRKPAVPDE